MTLNTFIMLCIHHHLSPEFFHFPKLKLYIYHTTAAHSSLSQLLATTILLSVSMNLTPLESSYKWHHRVSFSDWLVSLSMMSSSMLVHDAACVRVSFLFKAESHMLYITADICMAIFIAAVVTKPESWKQPKCPLIRK